MSDLNLLTECQLTSSEVTFGDTLQGREYIARTKAEFALEQSHKGKAAAAWTDHDRVSAIRSGSSAQSRLAVDAEAQQIMADAAQPDLALLKAAQCNQLNGWRKG